MKLLLSVATALIASLALSGCKRVDAQAASDWTVDENTVQFRAGVQPQGVQLTTVAKPGSGLGHFPGRLVWSDEVTARVFTPFSGRVDRILVHPGDAVHAGQPLLELSSGDYGQAQSEARKAQADLDGSRAQFDRAQDLSAAGVISRRDWEQAQTELRHAEAEWARSSSRLRVLGESASIVNGEFILRSPVSGVVVERAVNAGTEVRVDAAQPLFVITDPRRLTLLLDVPEALTDRIAPDAEVHFALSSDPAITGATRIRQIAAFVDPASRSVKARALVDNAQGRFRGETFVEAEVALRGTAGPEVPADALILIGQQYYLFAADGKGGFHRLRVTPGELGRRTVGIQDGVSEGQQIVADGGLYLEQLLEAGGKS